MIDQTKLSTYLERLTNDHSGDPGVFGPALAVLRQIQQELDSGRLSPDRTPIDEIKVEAKLKVRRNAPGTSWEAAYAQSAEKSQILYRAIYIVLSKRNATDDELRVLVRPVLDKYGYAPESVTNRRNELVKAGWVRATDDRRASDSGSPMTVWEAIPPL